MAVNNGPRVMVIGSINIDLVAGVDRLPREGETVWALGFEQHLGGKGANQAAVAGLMGAQAVMVGCVGDDVFGPRALQGLQQVGVDCSLVRTVAGTSTGAALITVGRRGENTIVVIPGANGAVTPADVERAAGAMAACDAVMVQFEVPEAVVLAVAQTIARLREAAARPLLVLNPSPFRASALPPAGTVDLLIVNELEAEEMTGHKVANPADAAEAARKLLPWLRPGGRVVVTLGEQGAVALSDGDMPAPLYIPARKVQAVDTTGAGDTFAGALVVQLCAGRSMAEALRFATTAAAITVTRPGAQSSFPRREEVEAALAGAPEPVPLLRKG
ncbi:MAG: ribokinase [Bacillota bacterium]|nr:ribokinase [Bacillota bacterium]